MTVANENFSVQGKLQTFTIAGDSRRNKTNKFCPGCGSVAVIEAEGFSGMALMMGGTLDDRPTQDDIGLRYGASGPGRFCSRLDFPVYMFANSHSPIS